MRHAIYLKLAPGNSSNGWGFFTLEFILRWPLLEKKTISNATMRILDYNEKGYENKFFPLLMHAGSCLLDEHF